MENRFLNWGIFIALGAVGFSFWWMNKSWHTEIVSNPQDLSYEMPRPKTVNPGYDLSNRRFAQNLLPGQMAEAKTGDGKAPATPPAKKDPKLNKDKKTDAKKTATNVKKKPQLGVRIVGAPKQGLSVIQAMANNDGPVMQGFQEITNPTPPPTAEPEEKEPKKTAAEWKALLMSSPTQANAIEFLKAFHSRSLSANDFYSISEELFTDASENRQKIGLYILKNDVSVRSFTILVSHYTDQTPEALKRDIYAVLKTYGSVSRFGVLSRLLYSTDDRVVAMATQVLTETVAMQGNGGQDDQTPPANLIPPANFRTFLPALTRLAQSDNSTIAQQAQALLQSIQNLLTA